MAQGIFSTADAYWFPNPYEHDWCDAELYEVRQSWSNYPDRLLRSGLRRVHRQRDGSPESRVRADSVILEDIVGRLTEVAQLDLPAMRVSADHGNITLEGDIDSDNGRLCIEAMVCSVRGVKQVRNRLHITELASEDEERKTVGDPQRAGQGRIPVTTEYERI